jgi:broad specificity phosphatase PhoE
MKLYFARHGQTDANAKMVSGHFIEDLDEALNQTGVEQAKELAEQLKDVQLDAIIASPLKRAYQTAELVNTYHGLPIIVDVVWRERRAGTYIDLRSWNDLFDFDKNISVEDGESLEEFFERIYAAIDNLKTKYINKTVLVVSHGGVQHAVYAYANRLPLSGNIRVSRLKNCEYRVYEL